MPCTIAINFLFENSHYNLINSQTLRDWYTTCTAPPETWTQQKPKIPLYSHYHSRSFDK